MFPIFSTCVRMLPCLSCSQWDMGPPELSSSLGPMQSTVPRPSFETTNSGAAGGGVDKVQVSVLTLPSASGTTATSQD